MAFTFIGYEFLQRSEMIIGKENIGKLKNSKVLVFGVGGVGGSLVESLTRAGIGQIDIVDRDVFDITNLNRQVMATFRFCWEFKG